MAPTPAVYVYSADNVAGGGTSGSGPQFCNMTHSYPSTNSITLHALTCVPQWRLDGTKLVHLTNYTAPTVYVPPSIKDTPLDLAVQAAIAGWNQANAANGIAVTLVRTTDECDGSGCIRIGALNLGFNCGTINIPATDETGAPSGPVDITVHSSYTSQQYYANGSLTQRVSHELGHLFGLTQNACTAAQSVMAQPTSCGAAQELQTPSYTDSHPVANTTYGGGSRNACQ